MPSGRRQNADLLTVTVHANYSGAVVVAVRGEVDLYTGPLLRDVVFSLLRPDGPPLVIDLADVDFLGAAGLSVLVVAREAAMAAGVRVSLVAHHHPVLLPLMVMGLDRVFDIYPALAGALPAQEGGPDA
ncbi:MAG: STAS domain-containing protein [Actinophytocola sp.]